MRSRAGYGAFGWAVSILSLAAVVGVADAQAKDKTPPAPKSIWEQETLTGDWGGARTALKDRGIEITLQYIGEVLRRFFRRPVSAAEL